MQWLKLLPIHRQGDDSQIFINFNINITKKSIIVSQEVPCIMNNSPTQLPAQLNNQLLHPSKPKIAFTYQANVPRGSIENHCPMSPSIVTQKLDLHHNISPPNTANPDKTPRKPGDKQNLFISPPRAFDNVVANIGANQVQYYKKVDNTCYKSNISNFCLMQNKTNSPMIAKLPPLSPKLTAKKTQTKCPSFLEKKSKHEDINLTQIHSESKQINTDINQICKCGKSVSHTFTKNQACCSKCAIGKMLQGYQLKPFTTLLQTEESEQKNFNSKSVILNKISSISSESSKIEKFLKDLNEQKENLQKHCKDNLEGEEHNINVFYRERKLELKTHYQKIKSAIKQSIEQDLRELQILQKQQLNQWRKSISVVQSDIKTLKKIEQEIKQTDHTLTGSKLKDIHIDQYKQIVKNRKMSKLGIHEAQTMNISTISNTLSNNLSSLNVTIVLKCFNINPQVYRPDIYRMVNNNQSKTDRSSRSSDLSSGSQISFPAVCHSPILGPAIQDEPVQKPASVNHKNLLFSFEGQK